MLLLCSKQRSFFMVDVDVFGFVFVITFLLKPPVFLNHPPDALVELTPQMGTNLSFPQDLDQAGNDGRSDSRKSVVFLVVFLVGAENPIRIVPIPGGFAGGFYHRSGPI